MNHGEYQYSSPSEAANIELKNFLTEDYDVFQLPICYPLIHATSIGKSLSKYNSGNPFVDVSEIEQFELDFQTFAKSLANDYIRVSSQENLPPSALQMVSNLFHKTTSILFSNKHGQTTNATSSPKGTQKETSSDELKKNYTADDLNREFHSFFTSNYDLQGQNRIVFSQFLQQNLQRYERALALLKRWITIASKLESGNRLMIGTTLVFEFQWKSGFDRKQYKSTCIRFQTIMMSLLVSTLAFNTGRCVEILQGERYKIYYNTAFDILRNHAYNEVLGWTLNDAEMERPQECSKHSIELLMRLCLCKLQHASVRGLFTKCIMTTIPMKEWTKQQQQKQKNETTYENKISRENEIVQIKRILALNEEFFLRNDTTSKTVRFKFTNEREMEEISSQDEANEKIQQENTQLVKYAVQSLQLLRQCDMDISQELPLKQQRFLTTSIVDSQIIFHNSLGHIFAYLKAYALFHSFLGASLIYYFKTKSALEQNIIVSTTKSKHDQIAGLSDPERLRLKFLFCSSTLTRDIIPLLELVSVQYKKTMNYSSNNAGAIYHLYNSILKPFLEEQFFKFQEEIKPSNPFDYPSSVLPSNADDIARSFPMKYHEMIGMFEDDIGLPEFFIRDHKSVHQNFFSPSKYCEMLTH